ncbi:MAG: FAD-dependent oxidoreductase [Bacteroidota bacterium]
MSIASASARLPRGAQRVLIVGAGLAGACAALALSRSHAVTVLEADRPASGASGAAAGLANPFMARKANPAWRYNDAFDALHGMLNEAGAAGLFRGQGVLRPAGSSKQAGFFMETAAAFPYDAQWWSAESVRERIPVIVAPDGALWLPKGGSVELPAMIEALLTAARARGAVLRTGVRVAAWEEHDNKATVTTSSSEQIEADLVMLCLGGGFLGHPSLDALGLHRVKGQTVRVRRPTALDAERLAELPALSSGGYIVPAPDSDELILGSSFEHEFEDLQPSPEVTAHIIANAARTLPMLTDAAVTHEVAGVRVTRHSARKPLLGPLPAFRRVWTFTALGAKGLLTAPLLAQGLPGYLQNPSGIPEEVQTP